MFTQIIITERVLLRPYEEEDVKSWVKWNIDPEVQAFLPEKKNEISYEEQLQQLDEFEEDPDYFWSIVWKENNKLIGTISITNIDYRHGTGEIGIVIGEKDYWGKGIASEVIKYVSEIANDEFGLKRIFAEFEEGNKGIEGALMKNGFEKDCILTGSRIKNGIPVNTIRYFKFLAE